MDSWIPPLRVRLLWQWPRATTSHRSVCHHTSHARDMSRRRTPKTKTDGKKAIIKLFYAHRMCHQKWFEKKKLWNAIKVLCWLNFVSHRSEHPQQPATTTTSTPAAPTESVSRQRGRARVWAIRHTLTTRPTEDAASGRETRRANRFRCDFFPLWRRCPG